MKVYREREANGLVIESEDRKDDELLCYLWSNHVRVVEFERTKDAVRIVLAPKAEGAK